MLKNKKSLSYIFEDRAIEREPHISEEIYGKIMAILGNPTFVLPNHYYLAFYSIFRENYSKELTNSWIEDYCQQLDVPFPYHLKPKFWYKHIFPKNSYVDRLRVYNHKIGNRKKDYGLLIEDTISEMSEYQKSSINSTLDGFSAYKARCAFFLKESDLPRIKGYDKLIKIGWYNSNNPMGLTKDHKVSVKYGYDNKIPPYILSHPANCEFMTLRENSFKNSNCSLGLEELTNRIKSW